jgi:phosphotransferase system  glucose/maltose/N-acetylglucosamine-specific IIC component
MTLKLQKYVTFFGLFGMALWFFGNLYEGIVFGPNWKMDNSDQLHHLNQFFLQSSLKFYFIPMTVLTVLVIWAVTLWDKIEIVKLDLLKASILALIISILSAYIVGFVLSQMFGPGFYNNPEEGGYYGKLWNILNLVRMILEVNYLVLFVASLSEVG